MKDFLPSLGKSFIIIFLSEIADRTFILILIYTSKISWFPLLITSILALGFMNVIAVSIGYLLPLLLLKEVVDWIGFACFVLFGVFSIYEACNEEAETVEDKLIETQKEEERSYTDIEAHNRNNNSSSSSSASWFSNCVQLCWLLIVSEIGDKSEITTIAIAALYDLTGVLVGTMLAYVCTIIMAIALGKFISKYITETQMNMIGGIIFLLFAMQILLGKMGIVSI